MIVIPVLWIIIAITGGILASNKGRSGIGWFILCLLIPLLIIIVLVLPGKKNAQPGVNIYNAPPAAPQEAQPTSIYTPRAEPAAPPKPRTIYDDPSVPAPPTSMRKCPFCAEGVQLEAVFCRHCKKDIQPAEAPKPECTMCGQMFYGDSTICEKCGYDRINNVMTGGSKA